MFDRILVAMGLTTQMGAIIPYARHLAIKFGSELHLLGISTEPQKIWDSSLMSYLENIADSLREDNIAIKTDFIHGNPAVEVVKYCGKNNIALIATAAGSCNEITCAILSNIAGRMGLTVNAPILMIPVKSMKEINYAKEVSFLKILVPLDCSPIGESVLPYVESIAQKVNSSITLLHVNTPPFRGVPIMHHEVIKISRAAGKSYIQKIGREMQYRGLNVDYEVIDGTPVKTILKYAKQHNTDLIAMGTHGSSGIAGWIFGNLTNKVSERTEVPILTVSYMESGYAGLPAPEPPG
jgi:nucleotide-binding universal stress UspA family protein